MEVLEKTDSQASHRNTGRDKKQQSQAATRENLTRSGEYGAKLEQGLREVVAHPSFEVFKMHLNNAPSNQT